MMYRALLLLILVLSACQRTPPPPAKVPTPPPVVQPPAVSLPWAATQTEPHAQVPLGQVVAAIRERATPERMAELTELLTPASVARLRQPNGTLAVLPVTIQAQVAGPFERVQLDGGRAGLITQHRGYASAAWFYLQGGHWRLDAANSAAWHPADPGAADPQNHSIPLAEATTDVTGSGALYAVLQTSAGKVHCLLLEAAVPELVGHFVGLARGKRAWQTPEGVWQHTPLYDGLTFHRGVPGLWVATGDPTQKGAGGAGFRIADVLRQNVRHDKPGTLSFLTLGQPNTASSQIGLFVQPAPWADDNFMPFGQCEELDVIEKLSRQPPRSQVLQRVTIQRGWP